MKALTYGDLAVFVAATNAELGVRAARDFAGSVSAELSTRDDVAVVLATGNSQLSFVSAVRERSDIDWSRINILHLDEYLGMDEDHPASFRRWMQQNLVGPLKPKAFYGIRGDHTPVEDEIARYTELLRTLDPAICVMGIGENGHLAFNDPPAEFDSPDLIRVVDLDEACRMQQVGEGHFAQLEDTPRRALTLTVPALLRPSTVIVITPETRKAQAVKSALEGPVTPACPASILQTASNARLYLDRESSSLLDQV